MNLLPQTQVDKRCPSRKKMETNLNPAQSPILTGWQGIWSWSLRLPSLPQDVSGTQEAGVEGPLALSPPCRALSSFNTPWASDLGDSILLSWGLGSFAQAARAGAQGPACPVHGPDPARAGVSEPPGPPSGLPRGKPLPCLGQAPSLPAIPISSFLSSTAPQ